MSERRLRAFPRNISAKSYQGKSLLHIKGREGVLRSRLEFKHMVVGISQTLLGEQRKAEDELGEEAESTL